MTDRALVVRDTGNGPWSVARAGQSASPDLRRSREDAVAEARQRLAVSGGAVFVLDPGGAVLEREDVQPAPPY